MGIMTKMFEFMSSAEVSYAKVKKCAKKFSVAAQAYMINTELQNYGKEVVASTAKHKRGNRCHTEPNAHIPDPVPTPTLNHPPHPPRYSPPTQMTTDTQRFMGAALNGRSLMCMIVTLSPAGQHGWETWFSLQYGTNLARLTAPVWMYG